jgi:hypothetical protein
MSQSAVLYRIASEVFLPIPDDPHAVNISLAREYVHFEQTHEVVRYLLTKICGREHEVLISEIFYPHSSIPAEDPLDENFDMPDLVLGYLDPEKLLQINTLLESVDKQSIADNMIPDELNSERVYPGNWDRNTLSWQTQIIDDVEHLKSLIHNALGPGDYVISWVG